MGPTEIIYKWFLDITFDGFPAVTLLVEIPGSGEAHLSPIHGDERKTGYVDIAPGRAVAQRQFLASHWPLNYLMIGLVPVITPCTERKRCLSPP